MAASVLGASDCDTVGDSKEEASVAAFGCAVGPGWGAMTLAGLWSGALIEGSLIQGFSSGMGSALWCGCCGGICLHSSGKNVGALDPALGQSFVFEVHCHKGSVPCDFHDGNWHDRMVSRRCAENLARVDSNWHACTFVPVFASAVQTASSNPTHSALKTRLKRLLI